ncbi:hypothetical protein C8F04DRAFT_1079541 [Mycena alexandri]|uniref:DUF6534 domain-containing protein n=1 Tax=Mycena alexandri TaxID=1745969 RepID=A0AAD6TAS0_9AGAR|nr:hypothetical protein C8F04DRAFT_1079541 [Mycena alexandri]
MQITTYFQAQRKDALWIRLLVFYVFFVETCNTALDISIMYQPLILDYGTIPGNLPTVFLTQPLCISLVQIPVEMFFIWRIHTLTGSRIIPGIFIALSVVAFGGGIWTTVALAGAGRWDNVSVSFHAATLWIAASMTTDLCIAFCLAWVLRRKKTGFGDTDTVVDRIIRMTVQTGLVTAVCNILDLLSFLLIKNSTLNFMWSNPLSKLYSNCMMSTLNARSNLKQSLPDHISDSGPRREDIGGASVLVAAPPFPFHAKTRSTLADDFNDREYGIRMNQVADRF